MSLDNDWACPAENRTISATDAVEFENTVAIIKAHDIWPRFGHTKNLTAVLYYEDRETAKDYLFGILSASFGIFIFFLAWMLVIIVMKCLDHKWVGFFSGRLTGPPKVPEDLALKEEKEVETTETPPSKTARDEGVEVKLGADTDGQSIAKVTENPYPGTARKDEEVEGKLGDDTDAQRLAEVPEITSSLTAIKDDVEVELGADTENDDFFSSLMYPKQSAEIPSKGTASDEDNKAGEGADVFSSTLSLEKETALDSPSGTAKTEGVTPSSATEHDGFEVEGGDDTAQRPPKVSKEVLVEEPKGFSVTMSSVHGSVHQHGQRLVVRTQSPATTELKAIPASGAVRTEDVEVQEKTARRQQRRIRRIRITVLISCLVVVVCCIMMVAGGIYELSQSLDSLRGGLKRAEELALSAVVLIDNFTYAQSKTLEAAFTLDGNAGCGPVAESICTILVPSSGGDCVPVDEIEEAVTFIRTQIGEELNNTRADLLYAADLFYSFNEKAGDFEWAFGIATAAAIVLAILALSIMSGVIKAWQNKLHDNIWQKCVSCVRGRVFVPLYILMVVIGWLFSMIFVIQSYAAADWCYNAPDQNVVTILNKMEDQFSSVLFQFFLFYVTGCPEESFPKQFQEHLEAVLEILGKLALLAGLLETKSAELPALCDTNAMLITAAAELLQKQVCAVSSSIYDLGDFLTCANWNELYAVVMYDAVCYEALTGFKWIAVAQILIVFFSMIILTLRVAFYRPEDEEEIAKQRKCCCISRRKHDNEAVDALMIEEQATYDFEPLPIPQAAANAPPEPVPLMILQEPEPIEDNVSPSNVAADSPQRGNEGGLAVPSGQSNSEAIEQPEIHGGGSHSITDTVSL